MVPCPETGIARNIIQFLLFAGWGPGVSIFVAHLRYFPFHFDFLLHLHYGGLRFDMFSSFGVCAFLDMPRFVIGLASLVCRQGVFLLVLNSSSGMRRLPRNHGPAPCRIEVKDHQARDDGEAFASTCLGNSSGAATGGDQ